MENGHLSTEQIEELSLRGESSGSPAEGDWSHIGSCQQCRGLLEKYRTVHEKFKRLVPLNTSSQVSMNCPDEKIWFAVAGGTLPPEEVMRHLHHAATCDLCGRKLGAAARIFDEDLSPAEEKGLDSLPSMQQDQQQKLVEKLGQDTKQQRDEALPKSKEGPRSVWRRLFLVAVPATAAIVTALIVSGPLYTRRQLREVQDFVDSEYSKGRPTYYRLARLPHQRIRAERGPGDLKPSIEISDSVSNKKPLLAAEAAFLEGDTSVAQAILEKAYQSGNRSPEVVNDLVVAYAMGADEVNFQEGYQQALRLSDEILDRNPHDPTVYFNRALIFQRLKREEDARKALQKFLDVEHDPAWRAEAERMLHSS